jgi:3-deoxy-7-phosphoheptulonate synthase
VDGLIIEVHPNPDHALSDGAQSLTPANFEKLMADVRTLAEAVGRPVAPPIKELSKKTVKKAS